MSDEDVSTHRRVIFGKHHPVHGITQLQGIFEGGATTLESLGWAIRDITNRRRLKKMLKRAGEVTTVERAEGRIVRVEGRIELLDPVGHPDRLGAYIRREVRDEPCGCDSKCSAVVRVVKTHRDAGRFLLRDATGAAIVSGPRLRLLDYHGRELDPFEKGLLAVRDGDSVTVVGEVKRESVDDPRVRVADGYRGVKLTPVFHGDAETPVLVFCEPTD